MTNATVVRLPSRSYDDNGDVVEGVGNSETIADAVVNPRYTSDIDARGRAGAVEGLMLYAPYDLVVLPTDRFSVDGVEYEVDGEAGKWKSPFDGWAPGVEVALKRAVG